MKDCTCRAGLGARVLLLGVLVLLSGLASTARADNHPPVQMGPPFVEGAVLQRGMKVPVWGWAEPGVTVGVRFAGQSKSAVAGEDGKWMLELDALEASAEPRDLVVTAGDGGHGLTVSGVLVGEVWVASGQSNMQWLASKCDVGRVLQAGIAERVEAGEEPEPIIREAKVTDVFSALHPIEKATVQWGDDAGQMSGIAYAFAYELWRELGVPIGILNCSFSSTAIEAWTPRHGFKEGKAPYTKAVYERILQTDPSTPEHKQAWDGFYAAVEDTIAANKKLAELGEDAEPFDIKPPGNMHGNRDAGWLYNARMHPVVPYGIRGAIWNQGYANIGGGLNYYHNLHSLVRGWREAWGREGLPVYFHQFYSSGVDEQAHPTFGPAAEMRTGTAMARDIPDTGMASQIDIEGSIHYYRKALPGQRLALHALKHQYGKDVAVNGPFYKSYKVEGDKLIVSFKHADGGLLVGQVETDSKLPAVVKPIEGADGSEVGLFYIADADRVWHRATCRVVGQTVELTSPGVSTPRGVSYGTGGIGFQPNIYNRALLPLTPFTVYDHAVVTGATWPDDPPKIAGYEPDPGSSGLLYEYRKLPILSTQFRDNAVLQHGVEVKVWGSAVHDWGRGRHDELVAGRETRIEFSFGDVKKTVPLTPGMKEWSVTLAPMEPTDKPRTLRAAFYIGDALAHERVQEGVVVGDVWFIAAPDVEIDLPGVEESEGIVRVMQRRAKRDRDARPSPYSVCVSTTPKNRFASEWLDAGDDLGGRLARHIASKVDYPVGVIFMQSSAGKNADNPPLKSWVPFEGLALAPSLAEDYAKLGASYPGSPTYDANLRRYVASWQAYWSDYIPEMIETGRVPDGSPWGVIPQLASKEDKSEATQSYNVMVHSFRKTAVTGIAFITSPQMAAAVSAEDLAEQKQALSKSWGRRFAGQPPLMFVASDGDVAGVIDAAYSGQE